MHVRSTILEVFRGFPQSSWHCIQDIEDASASRIPWKKWGGMKGNHFQRAASFDKWLSNVQYQIVIFVEICGLNYEMSVDLQTLKRNIWTCVCLGLDGSQHFTNQVCIGMIHCYCQQNSTKRGRSNSGSLLLSSTISLKTKQVMLILFIYFMFMFRCKSARKSINDMILL